LRLNWIITGKVWWVGWYYQKFGRLVWICYTCRYLQDEKWNQEGYWFY